MRILSLDWDTSSQRDLAAELEGSGHQVERLNLVSEALACDAERPFELVVAETRLPDKSGVQFLRELRDARGGAPPPVVFLAELDDAEMRELCLREGAARFLVKADGWAANMSEIHGLVAELEPALQVAATTRGDARVFRGNLETIEVLDIVQLLNLGRKTGVLVVNGGVVQARVHFEEGEIVAAEAGEESGVQAFSAVLALKRGSFRFESGPVTAERTIRQPTSTLMLDALRLQDESERRTYGDAPVPMPDEGAGFDFEHRAGASEPEQQIAGGEGWPNAGVQEADRPLPVPAPSAGAGWTPSAFEPTPGGPPAYTQPESAAASSPSWPATSHASGPAVREPQLSERDASQARDPEPLRLSGPGTGVRVYRLLRSRRRTPALVAATVAALLASGSAFLFSGVLRGPEDPLSGQDYRKLMLEAADNQARIDSLEQIIHGLSSSVGTGAVTQDAAKQQITLLQGQIQKAAAAIQVARLAVSEKSRESRESREASKPASKSAPIPAGSSPAGDGSQAPEAGRVAKTKVPAAETEQVATMAPGGAEASVPSDPAPTGAESLSSDLGDGRETETNDSGPGTRAGEPNAGPEPSELASVGVLHVVPETSPQDDGSTARLGTPEPAPTEAASPASPAPRLDAATEGPPADYSFAAIRRAPQFVPVDSRPSPRSPIRPRYPPALADRKVGGTVTLWVLVSASGGVEGVRVLRSSGRKELDRAASDAIRRSAYNPARRGGQAVAAWTQQQVVFRLE